MSTASSVPPVAAGREPELRPLAALSQVIAPALDGAPDDILGGLCRDAGALLEAEVVSIYVREGDDVLTMRANIGFADDAIGHLRIHVGDGLVGWVAASQRPIAIDAADRDPRFKRVRGIGEERYPVLLALPLAWRDRGSGVLVFQREASRPFSGVEDRLAGVVAQTASLLLAASERGHRPTSPAQAVSAFLGGRCQSRGSGLGRIDLLPSTEALAANAEPLDPSAIAAAISRVERELGRQRAALATSDRPAVARAFDRLDVLLSDGRFRQQAVAGGDRPLSQLARDYARAPFRLAGGGALDDDLVERARDIDELCAVLHGYAAGRLVQSGRVWIGERLGGFLALAAADRAAAVVLDGASVVSDDGRAIAQAAGLPVVSHVRGLFAWSRPGDLLAVDADRGEVRVNPSASNVMQARRPK